MINLNKNNFNRRWEDYRKFTVIIIMIIIGELINSTRDVIKEKIEEKDAEYIKKIAREQVECGANYVDVNSGAFVWDEVDYLIWLVETVQEVVDVPLTLDSPNPEALKKAAEIHKGIPMINSITAEKERYDEIMPILKEYKSDVIALCISDDGMPDSVDDRLKIAEKLIDSFEKEDIDLDRVYLDPLVKPISVNGEFGYQVLDTIQKISEWNTGIHMTCGLSNISYGLPKRSLLNQAFLIMAMERGLDSAIIDPTDKDMIKLIKAAEVLLNKDPYGKNYLKAVRAGELD